MLFPCFSVISPFGDGQDEFTNIFKHVNLLCKLAKKNASFFSKI